MQPFNALFPDFACDLDFQPRAGLVVSISTTPPNEFDFSFQATSRFDPNTDESIEVVVDVPGTVTVEDGEELYVAVEMLGDPSRYMCVRICPGPGRELADGRAFWSNRVDRPFAWSSIWSFGLNYAFAFEVDGFVDEPR